MDGFLARSQAARRQLLERASDELGLSAGAVEKDFWVCRVLRATFALPVGPHLAFKGGTALSKCYHLIERFSEDIDLVIERDFLGFGGEGAPERAGSGRERERRVEKLAGASRRYVGETLLPDLERELLLLSGSGHIVRPRLDPDAEDGQAILVEYESVVSGSDYVRPVVKLELGARSEVEPNEERVVEPYLVGVTDHGLQDFRTPVRVVAAERTFWDKVALLHEESHREGGPRTRLARHYYDVWRMDQGGVADRALATDGLFERVVEHRKTYFRLRREAQDSLRRGSVRLVPTASSMAAWRSDFEAMRDSMFFGEAPTFERIISDLRELEQRINAAGASAADA